MAFRGKLSEVYQNVFLQHRHPDGPWNLIAMATQAALPSGKGRVLDVAAGPGEPGLQIAKAMPGATVIITDISEEMVNKARARCEGTPNTSLAVADIQDLSQFEDNSFDVVTCGYGFMFCPDKQRAFDEAYRVLKPGGKLITTVWIKLFFAELALAVKVAWVGGEDVPVLDIDPMSLSRDGAVEHYLQSAGFALNERKLSSYPFDLGSTDDDIFTTGMILLATKLQEFEEEGKLAEIETAKRIFWQSVESIPRRDDGHLVFSDSVFALFVATK